MGDKCDGPVLPFEPDTGFLELEVIAGFRVWQLAFMGAFGILCIVIVMCCFMRCRIPRTKQEIEADVARKKVTKQFSKHLQKISIELMELEKVLPEVMTLEHQRILKGIKEEKMSLWQKVKKMICSSSNDDDDDDEDVEEEEEEEDPQDKAIDEEDDQEKGEDDEHGDDGDDDGHRASERVSERDLTEVTDGDDSCVVTIVEGAKDNGKSKAHASQPKRTSKSWKKIMNVTASSQAIARSQRKLKKATTDSPKTMAHRLEEVVVDKSSKKSDHHSTRHLVKSESSKRMFTKSSSTKRASDDHDDDTHEEITRL